MTLYNSNLLLEVERVEQISNFQVQSRIFTDYFVDT